MPRFNEYSLPDTVQIWAGTFNLNGRGSGVNEDLTAWLWPNVNRLQQQPGIVAVGFQEIVELSPQQIMSTDPVRRQEWENAVRRTLNDNARRESSGQYILLRSGQLVGAALMIFVKASILPQIKNVEGGVKKVCFLNVSYRGDLKVILKDWHVRHGRKQRSGGHTHGLYGHQHMLYYRSLDRRFCQLRRTQP